MNDAVRHAALRIGEEIIKSAKGNYYRHGWAHYLAREDVETLVKAVLEPTEVAVYEYRLRKELDA